MNSENPSQKGYIHVRLESYESRSLRRLHDDLGIDNASAEMILQLRSQVIELQSHIRQLEAELNALRACQEIRLVGTREVYYEATFIELEYPD